MLLDDRKAAILAALVETYIETGVPVSSSTVLERSRVGVSPATVRNDLAVLEREGYAVQPHTSAGRVPTSAAYRATRPARSSTFRCLEIAAIDMS